MSVCLLAERGLSMQTLKFTFWKDEDYFIGFLNDYPDYMTQGVTKEELIENLRELLRDINSNEIPYIRRVEEMAVSS
jgi:hypothetical protein